MFAAFGALSSTGASPEWSEGCGWPRNAPFDTVCGLPEVLKATTTGALVRQRDFVSGGVAGACGSRNFCSWEDCALPNPPRWRVVSGRATPSPTLPSARGAVRQAHRRWGNPGSPCVHVGSALANPDAVRGHNRPLLQYGIVSNTMQRPEGSRAFAINGRRIVHIPET